MSKKTSNKEPFSNMFKTSAAKWLDADKENIQEGVSFTRPDLRPVVPSVKQAADEELNAYWRRLRAFFRSGKGGGLEVEKEVAQDYPALLAPYWNGRFIQRDYPFWVNDGLSEDEQPFFTLPDFLNQQLDRLAPATDAQILRDNLLRLENIIRQKLKYVDEAFKAFPVFEEAIRELETQLSVSGEEGKHFSKDLKRLIHQLPKEGVLIPFSPNAGLHLMDIMIQKRLKKARRPLKDQITHLVHQLKDILRVEQQKTPEAHSAEQLHSSLEFADDFLNFEELSSVLPDTGSQVIPEERYHRILEVLNTLQKADELLFNKEAFICCTAEDRFSNEVNWEHSFSTFAIQFVQAGKLSQCITATFETVMRKAAELFAAIRIASLEVDNNYRASLHTDFFQHFGWQHFSERELAACPFIVMVAEAQNILSTELDDFSRLLASNRPVKILIEQLGREELSSGNFIFRQELGALAIAHRNTFILQSAIAQPGYLYEGFKRGLAATGPSLLHLLSALAGEDKSHYAGLWTSAAIEGREFPAFIFDPQKGPKWGNRFEIRDNPAPEADWPVHELIAKENDKEISFTLAFTFADFAALDHRFSNYFQLVPPAFWTEELIPISEYLQVEEEEGLVKVPYIWLLDKDNNLQRTAVAWPLVLICQERLDFWHYLQENAGVHSYHVEQATEQLRQELEANMKEKMAALETSFQQQLEEAKEKSARQAMEQLADVLLDLETAIPFSEKEVGKKKKTPPIEEEEEENLELQPDPEQFSPPVEEKTEELSLAEAWIDTPLCTTCNECIDTNNKIFQYNAEKQAFVADPAGGPFADIVLAAENCPVRIIHPGAPQNPDEPNLEEWVKRAESFQ